MLKQGDTIGIVALAGDCEKEKIDLAVKNIESMGYNIKLASNILSTSTVLVTAINLISSLLILILSEYLTLLTM